MAESFELLMTSVDGKKFAVPITSVFEVINAVDTTTFIDKPASIIGLINLRGEIVPVHDLRSYIGFESRELHAGDQIVILMDESVKVGVAVDAVESVRVYQEEQLFALSLSPTAFQIVRVAQRRLQLIDLKELLG